LSYIMDRLRGWSFVPVATRRFYPCITFSCRFSNHYPMKNIDNILFFRNARCSSQLQRFAPRILDRRKAIKPYKRTRNLDISLISFLFWFFLFFSSKIDLHAATAATCKHLLINWQRLNFFLMATVLDWSLELRSSVVVLPWTDT
jgi:hypothetical protein